MAAGDYDAHYLDKNNEVYAVFHRRGRKAWTHHPDNPVQHLDNLTVPCPVCERRGR